MLPVRNGWRSIAATRYPAVGLPSYFVPARRAPQAAALQVPDRSDGWNTATNILAASSLAVELVLPRVFFSDPDVTSGWKGRWHVSALAPVMTLAALGLFNEQVLKDAFTGSRPGCDSSNQGHTGCTS